MAPELHSSGQKAVTELANPSGFADITTDASLRSGRERDLGIRLLACTLICSVRQL